MYLFFNLVVVNYKKLIIGIMSRKNFMQAALVSVGYKNLSEPVIAYQTYYLLNTFCIKFIKNIIMSRIGEIPDFRFI